MNELPDVGAALSLEELLYRASLLLDARQCSAAATLIGAALRDTPDSVPALALRARCLTLAGDPELGLEAARAAVRLARPSDGSLAQDVLGECLRAVAAARLETARSALRRHDRETAWTILRGVAELGQQDRLFVLVCAYASGRDLPPGQLDEVLAWLLDEELEEAAAALERADARDARTALDRAGAIDSRSRQAALLEADAIHRAIVTGPPRTGMALRPVLADLRRASDLLQRLDDDVEYRDRARALRASIDHLSRRVAADLRVHRARELIGRHNAIVSTYTGRPISTFEASNARRSLAPLAADVAKLRRQCPPGSPEARALADLAAAITALQRQLQHYV
ncbi:hypothetical protein ACQP00_29835 [Dactylosporangium sp. CS-047395]|uniref:hypothetical protein n=1 Tax=Dactylosporangium sp. CS-047395 TaxID=3239936 RepID=UPI003D902221